MHIRFTKIDAIIQVQHTSSAPSEHLKVNCPEGAREATLGCLLEEKALVQCVIGSACKRTAEDGCPYGFLKTSTTTLERLRAVKAWRGT